MRWILPFIVLAFARLECELVREVWGLKRLMTEQDLTASLQRFEADLFAKMRADEKSRLGILAEQEAQRNRAIQEGMKRPPLGDFDKPAHWQ